MNVAGVIIFSIYMLIMLIIIIFIIMESETKGKTIFTIIVSFIFGIIFIGLIPIITNSPLAIDVYRNKTELVIKGEYKDSVFVATDSIVVYKNK